MTTAPPETLSDFLGSLWRSVAARFERGPVTTVADLVEFVGSRSAYVAQTSHYGYLKTRMGTRYVSIFQDDAFVESINIANRYIFDACVSDLTVFAVALARGENGLDDAQSQALANHCHAVALRQSMGDAELVEFLDRAAATFAARAQTTDWDGARVGESAFTESPAALFERAPIAEELKRFDRDIVMNSIRYRWRDVREQVRKRLEGPAVCQDWLRAGSGPDTGSACRAAGS